MRKNFLIRILSVLSLSVCTCGVVAFASVTTDAKADSAAFVPDETITETFDDAELNGFTAVGTGETFCVENGKLVSKGASTSSGSQYFRSNETYSNYVFEFTVSDFDAANQGDWISLVFAGNSATSSFTEYWNAGFVQFNPPKDGANGTWGIAKGSVSPTTADYKNPYQCEEYSKIRLSNINDKITVSWFNDGATEATGSFDVTLGRGSRMNSNGDGYVGMAFAGCYYSIDDVSITEYTEEKMLADEPHTIAEYFDDDSVTPWVGYGLCAVNNGRLLLSSSNARLYPTTKFGEYTLKFKTPLSEPVGENGTSIEENPSVRNGMFRLFLNAPNQVQSPDGTTEYLQFENNRVTFYSKDNVEQVPGNNDAIKNNTTQGEYWTVVVKDQKMTVSIGTTVCCQDWPITNKSGYIVFANGSGATISLDNIIIESREILSDQVNGALVYSNFTEDLNDDDWTIGNKETTCVTDGKLAVNNAGVGDFLGTTRIYENFSVQYDVSGLSYAEDSAKPAWIGIGFGGKTFDLAKDKFLKITPNSIEAVNYTAESVTLEKNIFELGSAHLQLTVTDGNVEVTVVAGAVSYGPYDMGKDLETIGKVFVPFAEGSTCQIDNLVVSVPSQYDSHKIVQKAAPEIEVTVGLGQGAFDVIDLGYMVNKSASFSTTDPNLTIEDDGFWSVPAAQELGVTVYKFTVVINDFVLDGWVNPLGEAGRYTLEGTITVTVVTEAQGGGSAEAPEVKGEATITYTQGSTKVVSYQIDTKGENILKLSVIRSGIKQTKLADGAYEYADGVLTLNADYVALLPIGITEYKLYTAYGMVSVTLEVTEATLDDGSTGDVIPGGDGSYDDGNDGNTGCNGTVGGLGPCVLLLGLGVATVLYMYKRKEN